jgi:hypothetical protein
MRGRTVAIAAVALFSGLGCQAASQSGPAAKRGEPTAPSAFSGITTVAMLALVNSTGVERATPLMTDDLESRIKAQGGYNYIGFDETAVRAASPEARADYDRLVRDWNRARSFDPVILSRFASAIGAQGVLAADLLTWTSEKLAWNVEGKSWSRVTCKLVFIDARNGKTIWSKTEDSLLESAYYDPSHADMGDQSGVPSTEVINRAPDPPDVEEAARQAAQRLAKELPKPKPAS